MKTIYGNGTASVLVNGTPTPSFVLQRGVRQGCPLAPYLYILAHDALALTLEDPTRLIHGLTLPNGPEVSNLSFADDSTLYLLGTEDNLPAAKDALDDFCLASGSQVNWTKTHAIWASKNPRTTLWGHELGLNWLSLGTHVIHLGIPIGFRISKQIRDEAALARLTAALAFWSGQKLSQAGRPLIGNQVILAGIWYSAACTDLSHAILSKSRARVRDFIWSGQHDHIARAKVAWKYTIQPLALGGIKMLDPTSQASSLLAKLLIRGLSSGYKP